MTIIGSADLLVSPKLAPNFTALLKAEVSAASGVAAAIPVPIKPQVDTASTAQSRKAFSALGSDAASSFSRSFKGGIETATPEMLAAFKKGGKAGLEDFLGIGAGAKQQAAEAIKAEKEIASIKAGIARTSLTSGTVGLSASTTGLKAEQDILRTQKNIKALGSEISKAEQIAATAGSGVGAAFVNALPTLAAVAVGVEVVIKAISSLADAAGKLQQAEANVNAVFGESAGIVTSFANDSSKNLLQSKAAADQAAASFGLLFNGLNINDEQSAQLSVRLTSLAQSLALVRGISIETAERLLSAGVAGNPRAFKQLGLNINDVDIKARGLADGITHGNEALSTEAKTLVTLNELFEKTAGIEDQAAKSTDNYVVAQQRLTKAVEDSKASIGTGFLPQLTDLVNGLTEVANLGSKNGSGAGGIVNSALVGIPGIGNAIAGLEAIGAARSKKNAAELADAEATKKAAEADKTSADALNLLATAAQRASAQALSDATARFTAAQRQGPDAIAVVEARRNIERATIGVTQAEEKLADARKDQIRIPHQIAEAELSLASARLSSDSALLSQRKTILETQDLISGVDRRDRLEDLQLRAAEATLSLDKALQAEKKSLLDVRDAQNDLLHAQFEFIGVTRDRHRGILDLRDAQLKIDKAEQAIADQKLSARGDPLSIRRAQLDVQKVAVEQSRFAESQAIREAEAKIQLAQAENSVQSAALGVISATNALTDLRETQARQADVVRLAELGLGTAQDTVTLAVYASATAVAQLVEDLDVINGKKPLDILKDKYAAFVGEMNANSALLRTGTTDILQGLAAQIASLAEAAALAPFVFSGGGGGAFGGHGASGSFQHGGNVIPGAQFGMANVRSKLIHVGESGDEWLSIKPGGRADIIPHGGKTTTSGPTIGEVHIHESPSPESTLRALEWRIGMESQR